jgi:ligand-binding SRPBCC domain-containing protein
VKIVLQESAKAAARVVSPVKFEKSSNPRAQYRLSVQQWLPRPLPEVFEFFSDASKLEILTPPWLSFQILTPTPIPMAAGALIDYRLKLRGVPIRWRTRISEWEPMHHFVDEQLRGPYWLWHHTHLFEEQEGGTLVTDRIDYSVPGGALIHWLLVKGDLHRVFNYRLERLAELLG